MERCDVRRTRHKGGKRLKDNRYIRAEYAFESSGQELKGRVRKKNVLANPKHPSHQDIITPEPNPQSRLEIPMSIVVRDGDCSSRMKDAGHGHARLVIARWGRTVLGVG
jgi:hypothetical protein